MDAAQLRLVDSARAAPHRQRRGGLEDENNAHFAKLRQMRGQAKRFSKEVARGTKRARNVLQQLVLEGLRQELDAMVPLVQQVMKQTRARIFRGDTHAEGKILSLFEPDGDHSQRQGRQAERVRQDGEVAGGRGPDRDRLRGL
jgi:transposase, IS5 family